MSSSSSPDASGALVFEASEWARLVSFALSSPLSPASRVAVRRVLTLFPTAYAVAAAAARRELPPPPGDGGGGGVASTGGGDLSFAKAIFEAHLHACPFAELWCVYVEYVKATHERPAEAALAAAAAAAAAAPPPGGGAASGAAARADAAARARRVADAAAALASARDVTRKALELAVERVGQSADAGPLWALYVAHANGVAAAAAAAAADAVGGGSSAAAAGGGGGGGAGAGVAAAAYGAGAAREARRRAYARAVSAAHAATDALWAEYCAFERSDGAAAAAGARAGEAHILARQADAATAGAVARERAALWADVDARRLPLPPPRREGRDFAAATAAAAAQVAAWRRVLSFELSNPLLAPPDAAAAAVRLAFCQATACVRFAPDVWADWAAWAGSAGAPAVFDAALAVMPSCIALVAAAADAHEAAGAGERASGVWCAAVETLSGLAAGRHGGWRAAAVATAGGGGGVGGGGGGDGAAGAAGAPGGGARAAGAGAAAEEDEEAAPGDSEVAPGESPVAARSTGGGGGGGGSGSGSGGGGGGAPPPSSTADPIAAAIDAAPPGASPLLVLARAGDEEDARRALPHAFILWQRTARRAEGVDAARAVFAAARKSPHVTPRVFLASAQLEWAANRALPVARNVLEAGRRRWPRDADFAAAAADLLAPLDESTNVRALLEAALAAVPPRDARPLWDRFLAYELAGASNGGSLAAVAAVERRRAAALPWLTGADAPALLRAAARHAAFLPPGAPPGALSACDADVYSRAPYAPFATLAVSAAGGGPAAAGAVEPPEGESPLELLRGRAALALSRERDGLFLQAPPLLGGGALAHVSARDAFAAGASSRGGAGAWGGGALHQPLGAPLAPLGGALAWAAQQPLGAAGAGAGAGAVARAGAAAANAVAPPAPPAPPPPPPPAVRALLARLPAVDYDAGPPPPVDELVAALRAMPPPPGDGQPRAGGAARKRARDDL